MMDEPKNLDEVLEIVKNLSGAERARVLEELTEKGSEVSQPIDGAHTRLKHAGAVEKTWVYDGPDEQVMLDQEWITELNDNDSKFPGQTKVYKFIRERQWRWKIDFEVNTGNMTIENFRTKEKSNLHRKEMRVLSVKGMLAEDDTHEIDALQKNGWTVHWQFEGDWGWENMSEQSNQTLLAEFARTHTNVELTHEWTHPRKKARKTTIYDVDISEEQQTSRDGTNNKRAVRLVAMRAWDRHN